MMNNDLLSMVALTQKGTFEGFKQGSDLMTFESLKISFFSQLVETLFPLWPSQVLPFFISKTWCYFLERYFLDLQTWVLSLPTCPLHIPYASQHTGLQLPHYLSVCPGTMSSMPIFSYLHTSIQPETELVLSKHLWKIVTLARAVSGKKWEQIQTTGRWSKNERWVLETERRDTSSTILLEKSMSDKSNSYKRTQVRLSVHFVRWERLKHI